MKVQFLNSMVQHAKIQKRIDQLRNGSEDAQDGKIDEECSHECTHAC